MLKGTTMNTDYKIKVEHVSKCFKMYNTPMDKMKEAFSLSGKCRHTEFYAITDLSFSVSSGEILGIMGRNGSGKSTLLKLITGIYEPSGGQIMITGKVSSLLELGTGFNMEYTGVENIYFYVTLMGFTREQMEEKFNSIIDFAEIGDYVYQPVKTYSSGMFARLAFSCAVNVEPDILIVDEILSVGDMRFQAKCFNKFKEFKDKGVTILYVGHDVATMRTFCDTAMWINKGRMVDIGDPTFISAKYTEFMYLDEMTEFTDYRLLGHESEPADTENACDGENDGDVRNAGDVKIQESENREIPKSRLEEPIAAERKIKDGLFPDCIAHWGYRTGIVKSVRLCNKKGEEISYFSAEDIIKISISFDVDDDIDIEFFSIAVSIKNTEGTDLIVKTTFDEDMKLHAGKKQEISFELMPGLANGDYYLVVAVENRENASIAYYEYIEGACFFKAYTSRKIFGVYDVAVKIMY